MSSDIRKKLEIIGLNNDQINELLDSEFGLDEKDLKNNLFDEDEIVSTVMGLYDDIDDINVDMVQVIDFLLEYKSK
jgi:ADP-dependent phosphofructokinase/glucokinase